MLNVTCECTVPHYFTAAVPVLNKDRSGAENGAWTGLNLDRAGVDGHDTGGG